MLPIEIQEMLKGSSVRIVIDNAKSHGSRIKHRMVETPKSMRRMSEPHVSTNTRTAKMKTSRWDSTPNPASSSIPQKPWCCIMRDLTPQLKLSSASPPAPRQTLCSSLFGNVSKPVRRNSGDKKTILTSLSIPFNNECCTNQGLSTAELLVRALDAVHLFDDDDDDDVDTVASVLSAPARLVTGAMTST
jgi:hypothetical protein